jgi:hypothetical protein
MVKVRLHSHYNHFGNHKPLDGEPYIECFNDDFVMQDAPEHSVALLIEPRSIQPKVYEYIEQHPDKFEYIFTHDSKLLELPNAKLILWGWVVDYGDTGCRYSDVNKTKNISFVSSNKIMCDLHKDRLRLAYQLSHLIDCMGNFNGGDKVGNADIYRDYRFSIAFENYIDDFWFTEKLCNCFANHTIPIYYGAKKIGQFFDTRGMIICRDVNEIIDAVNFLVVHGPQEYELRREYVERNAEYVKRYENFETWFFREYEPLLGGMLK